MGKPTKSARDQIIIAPTVYADHPCRGNWCTPIPSQRLVFALFVSNSLAGPFHLCFYMFPLSFSVSPMTQRTQCFLSPWIFSRYYELWMVKDLNYLQSCAEKHCLWTSLTKFGTKWWTTNHPCLQRLCLLWILLLYSILITSPVTN